MTPFDTPGLLVPPLTPFDQDGKVDRHQLNDQIDYVVDACDPTALVVMGVEAQEYRYLSIDERADHVQAVAEYLDGRVPFVAGVSAPDPADAIELGRVAESAGAAAVQALVPSRVQGGTPRREDLTAYFRQLGTELGVPIVAYHNPLTGASLSPADLTAITRVNEVVAVKESSRNMRHVLRLIESIDRAGLAQYFTTMELLVPSLVLGGSGATMPPPAAELGRRTIDAFTAGNLNEATQYQRAFAEFPARWIEWGLAPVMKAALDHLGFPVGNHPAASGLSPAACNELTSYVDGIPLAGLNGE